jgi:hypothetical protein
MSVNAGEVGGVACVSLIWGIVRRRVEGDDGGVAAQSRSLCLCLFAFALRP